MTRIWLPTLLLFFGLVLGATLVCGDSKTFQSCVREQTTHYGTRQQVKSTANVVGPLAQVWSIPIQCAGRLLDVNHDSITAFATLVIAFFTVTLWISTSGQLRHMRDEFNLAHRPKIRVRKFGVAPLEPGKPIQISWSVYNVGESSCRVVDTAISVVLLRNEGHFGGLAAFGPRVTKEGAKRLYPGTQEDAFIAWMPSFTADEIEAIISRARHLHVVGEIAYIDGHKVMRRTGFLRVFDPDRNRFSPVCDPDYEYED